MNAGKLAARIEALERIAGPVAIKPRIYLTVLHDAGDAQPLDGYRVRCGDFTTEVRRSPSESDDGLRSRATAAADREGAGRLVTLSEVRG